MNVGCAKADEAGEEGLIQMAVLLEGHVLHHRRQLMVVSYQDHTLQSTVPIFLPLQVSGVTVTKQQNKWVVVTATGGSWWWSPIKITPFNLLYPSSCLCNGQ